jgi:hypothetical protein
MPTWGSAYRLKPPTCSKPYRWSTMRGGCRFEPNHAGDCKPKARRR